MFTGIVQDIGTLQTLDKSGDWLLTIASPSIAANLALGASVACNGICLTVTAREVDRFSVQLSAETLSKTTAIRWREGTRLNLERALRLGDELGGHIMSGHVDGVARVVDRGVVGESLRYLIEAPPAFTQFLAPKGSITLDGVSLTINDVDGVRFATHIIPHTQQMTTIGALALGDEVNFEIDMMARYIERALANRGMS